MELPVIEGAQLYDVVGTPRQAGRFLFVPVLLELESPNAAIGDGWWKVFARQARDYPPRVTDGSNGREALLPFGPHPNVVIYSPDETCAWWDRFEPGWGLRDVTFSSGIYSALWVRARLPAVFGYAPTVGGDMLRQSFLAQGFLAVEGARSRADLRTSPFVCTDEADGPELLFPGSLPLEIREAVSGEFWSLLLSDPFDLRPFRGHFYDDYDHDCDGPLEAGLDRAGFYVESVGNWDSEDGRVVYDGHFGYPIRETRPCEECGGTGEESFCPAGAVCEICQGTGEVSWRGRPREQDRRRPGR